MQRPNLKVVAGRLYREAPVEQVYRTESLNAAFWRWAAEVSAAVFFGLCILAAVYMVSAMLLSLEAR